MSAYERWSLEKLGPLCFILLLILFFKIMPKPFLEYFLGEPFAVKGHRIIFYAISWLVLLGALCLLSLLLAEQLNKLIDTGFDALFTAIFAFLHI